MAGESRLGAVLYDFEGSEVEVEHQRRGRFDPLPHRRRRCTKSIRRARRPESGRQGQPWRPSSSSPSQIVRRDARARRHRPRRRGRRIPDPRRPLGLRQVDPDPHHRRPRERRIRGSVSIGGSAVDHLRPHERRVAMVFQSYALYPHMTVFANIALPLVMSRLRLLERLPLLRLLSPRRRRVMREHRARGATRWRSSCRSSALLDRRPAQLSGGQRQRVALGRAMVRHPDVFLMDEPLSNLDAKLRVHMRTELAELHAAPRRDLHLRDARPGRGDDDVRSGRHDGQRRHPAARHAERALRAARERQGRAVHRQPGDQPASRHASAPAAGSSCSAASCRSTSRCPAGAAAHARHPPRGDRGATRDGGSGRSRPGCSRRLRRRENLGAEHILHFDLAGRRPRRLSSAGAPARCTCRRRREVALAFDAVRLPRLRCRRALASRHGARPRRSRRREPASCLAGASAVSDFGNARPGASPRRAPALDRARWPGIGFAMPAFLLLLLTNLAPLLPCSRISSFTDYELGALDFALPRARQFPQGARRSGLPPLARRTRSSMSRSCCPGRVVLGLLVAVLLHERKRTRALLRGRSISCRSPRR